MMLAFAHSCDMADNASLSIDAFCSNACTAARVAGVVPLHANSESPCFFEGKAGTVRAWSGSSNAWPVSSIFSGEMGVARMSPPEAASARLSPPSPSPVARNSCGGAPPVDVDAACQQSA